MAIRQRNSDRESFGKWRMDVRQGLVFIRAVADLILNTACYIPHNQELADSSHATRKWGSVLGMRVYSELQNISKDICCQVDTG